MKKRIFVQNPGSPGQYFTKSPGNPTSSMVGGQNFFWNSPLSLVQPTYFCNTSNIGIVFCSYLCRRNNGKTGKKLHPSPHSLTLTAYPTPTTHPGKMLPPQSASIFCRPSQISADQGITPLSYVRKEVASFSKNCHQLLG